ncbi:MAG: peptidoglycan-associated lipoprotein Pal [Candidatus Methylomirabilales bacterium]
MIQPIWRLWATAGIITIALTLAGCPKKPVLEEQGAGAAGPAPQVVTPEPPKPPMEEPVTPRPPVAEAPVKEPAITQAPVVEPRAPAPTPEAPRLKDVFFDFDKAVLRPDAKAALDENLRWLRANVAAKIVLEGHCDERGTNEYNLALGERRAQAVRDYLVAAGIDAGRISTISYGEERPFVLGHDESAWKWNRRGHFVVVGQ